MNMEAGAPLQYSFWSRIREQILRLIYFNKRKSPSLKKQI